MRKHFLLLFLMALLPLAGWAQIDISGYTVEIHGTASYVYNGAAQVVTLDVTAPGATEAIPAANYDVEYFDEAGTTPVAAANVKNAGTYKVRAKGKGSYTGETAMITFVITRKSIAGDSFAVTTTGGPFSYDGTAKTFTTVTFKDGETTLTPATTEANNDYTFVYVDNTDACAATDEDAAYILFTGYGNYQGTKKYKFAIAKADIPYAVVNAATPAAVTDLKYTGILQNLATAGAALDANYGTVQYKVGTGAYAAALPQGLNADTYDVRWKIVGSNNYNDVAEAQIAASYYTKAELTTINTAVQALGDTETLSGEQAAAVNAVLGTAYTDATTGAEVDKDALGDAVEAIGDVTTTVYVKTRTTTVAIGKSASKLRFVTIGKTKEAYDGTPLSLAEGQFSITGWAAGDNAEIQATRNHIVAKYVTNTGTPESPVWTEQAATTVGPDAGTYYVQANVADAKYTNAGGVEILLSQNYDFTIVKNAWVIERAPLTITAKSQSVAFGTALPTIASIDPVWEVSGAVTVGGVTETPQNVYEVVYNGTYTPEGGVETALAAGKTDVPFGPYANAYKVQLQGGEAAPANYEVTLVNGTLTITGAAFSIFATVPNTIQYGEKIVPNYIALDSHDELATVDADEIEYIYKQQVNDEWVAWTKAQESDPNYPITRGTYTIEVKQKNTIGTGNFQGVTPECPTTPFSIVAKNITIDIPAVELWNGATKTILNQKVNVPEADYEDQLVYGEHINFEFVFKSGVDGLAVGDEEHDYAITFATAAPLFVNGTSAIEGKMVAGDGFSNDNYLVTWTGGELTATDLAALDLDLRAVPAAEIYSKIKDASDICKANPTLDYTVKLKLNRSNTIGSTTYIWKAKKYAMLVLPFDVKVTDLSEQLGYAVVNVADKTKATANNVYWVLEWGTIPANTPFVVRTAEDITNKEVEFDDVKIAELNTKYPTVDAGSNINLVGAYETFTIDESSNAKLRFFTNDNAHHGISAGSANTWYVVPFDGYIDMTGVAAAHEVTFTFEELDGSTTAIKAVEFNGQMANAEGWYTIDGMKLNAAPTQKGIYINNGKKIVVK